MLSRARFAVLVLGGAAADFADYGVALSRVRMLNEMASAEDLSNGTCVPYNTKNKEVDCDMHGNRCALCGPPRPGRGYDGHAVYSSTLAPGTVVNAPDYIMRDDCGNHSNFVDDKLSKKLVPVTTFNQKSQAAFPGWTNAWCETNVQKVCADAVTNRDYLFQPKTYDIPRNFSFDFYFCKYNGWLSVESRTIVTQGFDAVHNHTVDFCAQRNEEFPFDYISSLSMSAAYLPGLLVGKPTPEQARYLGAWGCAMGGADGESTGAGCDMAYCHYTYGEINPTAGSSQEFCVYDDCEGWNALTGMPVSEYATLARHADSAAAVHV